MPKYVRLQRQKAVLKRRLKIPPTIHQFSKVLDRNTAAQVFRLLSKYTPETKAQKKERLAKAAEAAASGADASKDKTKKPLYVKYGLNHVTALIEAKKPQLVLIADDVEPIEVL